MIFDTNTHTQKKISFLQAIHTAYIILLFIFKIKQIKNKHKYCCWGVIGVLHKLEIIDVSKFMH